VEGTYTPRSILRTCLRPGRCSNQPHYHSHLKPQPGHTSTLKKLLKPNYILEIPGSPSEIVNLEFEIAPPLGSFDHIRVNSSIFDLVLPDESQNSPRSVQMVTPSRSVLLLLGTARGRLGTPVGTGKISKSSMFAGLGTEGRLNRGELPGAPYRGRRWKVISPDGMVELIVVFAVFQPFLRDSAWHGRHPRR
jgi:hypothetical protein